MMYVFSQRTLFVQSLEMRNAANLVIHEYFIVAWYVRAHRIEPTEVSTLFRSTRVKVHDSYEGVGVIDRHSFSGNLGGPITHVRKRFRLGEGSTADIIGRNSVVTSV